MADEHQDVRREAIERMMKAATDSGLLIEAGWLSLRLAAIPATAGDTQLREMRMAFFAGAQHLFSSIMTILDAGADPTPADLRRMDAINEELGEFVRDLEKDLPTAGRG